MKAEVKDDISHGAYKQIEEPCTQWFAIDSKIRIMPDAHEGAGCTIGTTMTINENVVPNLVGVDIGSGMYVIKLITKWFGLDDLVMLDRIIIQGIPSGFAVRKKMHAYSDELRPKKLKCYGYIDADRAMHSIGNLGETTILLSLIDHLMAIFIL